MARGQGAVVGGSCAVGAHRTPLAKFGDNRMARAHPRHGRVPPAPAPREAEAAEAAEAAAVAAEAAAAAEEEGGPTSWSMVPLIPPPEGWAFAGAPAFVRQGSYQFEFDCWTGR